jgi:hypothetical protein
MHLRSGFVKRGVTGKFTIHTAETLTKTKSRTEKLEISTSNKPNNQIQTQPMQKKTKVSGLYNTHLPPSPSLE